MRASSPSPSKRFTRGLFSLSPGMMTLPDSPPFNRRSLALKAQSALRLLACRGKGAVLLKDGSDVAGEGDLADRLSGRGLRQGSNSRCAGHQNREAKREAARKQRELKSHPPGF